jgi:carboxymethylenebutenolidase
MLRCLVCALSLVASVACAQEAALSAGKAVVLTTAYGTRFDAYVIGPEDASRTVLLLHDRYGLNAQSRDWAARFAGLGYRALAIDLYDGRRAKSWKHATTIMDSIDQEWVYADISAALSYLKGNNPQRKIAILGWDYGGTEALLATLRYPVAVAATVSYYPAHLDISPSSDQTVETPMMLVLAKRDAELHVRPTQVIKGGLGESGINFIVQGLDALANLGEIADILRAKMAISVTGVDADRGFSDPLSEHYDAAATASAWDVTQEFLSRYLTP